MAAELRTLRRENAALKEKNESMRAGMRRCVTCDYRVDYKRRQGDVPLHDGIPEDNAH